MNQHEQNQDDSTRDHPSWSDEMIERLIDGEASEELAAALREELRRHPEARRELDEIRRTDALAARVLDGLMDGRMDGVVNAFETYQRRAARRILAVAACTCSLACGAFVLGWYFGNERRGAVSDGGSYKVSSAGERLEPGDSREGGRAELAQRSAVRTLFEVVLASEAGAEMWSEGRGVELSASQSREARAFPEAERVRRYIALGRTLRSAELARQTLDAMAASEQLEACRVWARDPSLRPVAFERLARLQNDPVLAGECARIASEMSVDSVLLAWARSHGLRMSSPTAQ